MSIVKRIKKKIEGPFKSAINEGMCVGVGVTCGGGCNFGTEPYLITLDDNVRISFDVTFLTHDGGTYAFRDLDEYKQVSKFGSIYIGKNSFIGCKSIIMPGVKIGSRCVIGAGSIVTKDVPDGMVVCGVPAKVMMTTEEYADKCKKTAVIRGEDEKNLTKKEFLMRHYLQDNR